MTDQNTLSPQVVAPSAARNALRRHLRGSSPSPGRLRRQPDDLLDRLHPATAVEALRHPTGALKRCLGEASPSEQSFAIKTAVASHKIYHWLEELSHWPWPKHGGPAGFELPPAKRRKLFEVDDPAESPKGTRVEPDPQSDVQYFGSLPAEDVARYEKRIGEIQEEMESLELEDIKSQVLHNHILPLSRPGTPFSDAGLSVTSSISYTKFDDLSAVVTALIVQTLPKLSRLSRLLNAWSIRLVLLRKTPAFFAMLADAEVALKSGWNAVRPAEDGKQGSADLNKGESAKTPIITRKDFEVMKSVLHEKITKPGKEIDAMLDALEAMEDTLPNEWLERLETMEADYARWEIAAERQVQEGERLNARENTTSSDVAIQPTTPQPKIKIQKPSPTREFPEFVDDFLSSPPSPVDRTLAKRDPAPLGKHSDHGATKILVDNPSGTTGKPVSAVIDLTDLADHQRDIDSGAVVKDPSLDFNDNESGRASAGVGASEGTGSNNPSPSRPTPGRRSSRSFDGINDGDAKGKLVLAELDRNIVRAHPASPSKVDATTLLRSILQQDTEPSSILESVDEGPEEEDDEPALPPTTRSTRRDSQLSMASTVLHGSPSRLEESDEIPFREESGEPELPNLPNPDEPFSSDGLSPPSSPPLRYKPRSTSVTFKYEPETAPTPERGSPPRSPLDPPIVFDPDVSYEIESQVSSPGRPNTTNDEDRRLQQQIGAILESIPLKIRLNNKASTINLNPPDFQPPRAKPRTSNINRQRSASSLSSRAATPSTYSRSGTPSYMLAPARNHGPRSKSSQDIKVYHLMKPGSDAPIKLFIRTVGETNERVMVRVGGGWSDLGEYLKEYASHHGRRSRGEGKVEVTDLPTTSTTTAHVGSSPSNRPSSAMDTPITPLRVRKARKSLGEEAARVPRTPIPFAKRPSEVTPNSDTSARSRNSSKADWDEESSSLGLAGPNPKKVEVSEENMAWIKSVKEKVRVISNGERSTPEYGNKFGEINKIGGTTRVFRRN